MYAYELKRSEGAAVEYGPDYYVFYARPFEVWAVEFTNLAGDRVVEVLGTEHAARQALEQYWIEDAVLLRSPTDFRSVSTFRQPDRGAS